MKTYSRKPIRILRKRHNYNPDPMEKQILTPIHDGESTYLGWIYYIKCIVVIFATYQLSNEKDMMQT